MVYYSYVQCCAQIYLDKKTINKSFKNKKKDRNKK